MARRSALLKGGPDVNQRVERLVVVRIANRYHPCRFQTGKVADDGPAQFEGGRVCEDEEPVVFNPTYDICNVLLQVLAYDDFLLGHCFPLLFVPQRYT